MRADTPPGPEAAAPAPRRHRPDAVVLGPPTAPEIAAITVCVVAAGVVAGTRPRDDARHAPGYRQYASLPAQPCSMVRSADVARYLPGANGQVR